MGLSKTLSLCQRRLRGDWLRTFGHPLVLLESSQGEQIYRAARIVTLSAPRLSLIVPKGIHHIRKVLPEILEDGENALTSLSRPRGSVVVGSNGMDASHLRLRLRWEASIPLL